MSGVLSTEEAPPKYEQKGSVKDLAKEDQSLEGSNISSPVSRSGSGKRKRLAEALSEVEGEEGEGGTFLSEVESYPMDAEDRKEIYPTDAEDKKETLNVVKITIPRRIFRVHAESRKAVEVFGSQ